MSATRNLVIPDQYNWNVSIYYLNIYEDNQKFRYKIKVYPCRKFVDNKNQLCWLEKPR